MSTRYSLSKWLTQSRKHAIVYMQPSYSKLEKYKFHVTPTFVVADTYCHIIAPQCDHLEISIDIGS